MTDRNKLLGIALGAAVGYAYYIFIGCVAGTCPITSNPWASSMYGALLGWFIAPSRRRAPAHD